MFSLNKYSNDFTELRSEKAGSKAAFGPTNADPVEGTAGSY